MFDQLLGLFILNSIISNREQISFIYMFVYEFVKMYAIENLVTQCV